MCPIRATCLPVDCFFSERAQIQLSVLDIIIILWNVTCTCSRLDIAETITHVVSKQQSFTHSIVIHVGKNADI